jgi:hypothetical protein
VAKFYLALIGRSGDGGALFREAKAMEPTSGFASRYPVLPDEPVPSRSSATYNKLTIRFGSRGERSL